MILDLTGEEGQTQRQDDKTETSQEIPDVAER